jgi:hypothetical protein
MQVLGKLTRIAGGNDATRGIMPEQKGRVGNRHTERLQVARRNGNNEPVDLTPSALLKAMGNRLDVVVVFVLHTWIHDAEGGLNEACQLVALGGV